jgi:hypothetical protein
VQFVATLQGISVLANATKDCDMACRQITRMRQWIEKL